MLLLYCGCCALLWKLARLRAGVFAGSIITGLGGVLLLQNFGIRPFLFGNICFALCLLMIEEPTGWLRYRKRRIFLLFALWANLHGSVLLGLGTLAVYAALEGSGPRWRLRDLGVALVGACITPRGPDGLLEPLRYIGRGLGKEPGLLEIVSEWQALDWTSGLGLLVGLYILAAFGGAILGAQRPKPAAVIVALGFVVAAALQVRHIPLVVLAAAPLAGLALSDLAGASLGRRLKGLKRLHDQARGGPEILGLVLLLSLCMVRSDGRTYLDLIGEESLESLSEGAYPEGLISELKRRGRAAPPRLMASFDWGGALIWAGGPYAKVFVDPRVDCYPAEVAADYITLRWMKPGWEDVLTRWQPDALAFAPTEPLAQALRDSEDWRVSWEDEEALLLVPAP